MSAPSLQEQVAEKRFTLFPGRQEAPDDHMIGSIGEVLVAAWHGLKLFDAS